MKNRGIICIIIGLLLIGCACGLTGYNLMDDVRAGEEAASIVEALLPMVTNSDIPTEKPEDPEDIEEMPKRAVDGNEYVAVVSIPSIGRQLPVFSTWNYVHLRSGACRYYGSVYTNDLVVCAHNYDRHFGQIKNLAIGDPVTVIDMNGTVFKYEVTEVDTLSRTDISRMVDGDDWDLTLFTCTIGGVSRVTVRCCRVG